MSLDDDLTSPPPAESIRAARPSYPRGWEPGSVWTGRAGTIITAPIDGKPDWSALLRDIDLDPALVEVLEPVEWRTWDAAIGNGEVRKMRYWKARIQTKRTDERAEIDELLALVKRSRVKAPAATATERAWTLVHNDWQLGKLGTPQAVDRIVRAIDASADHVRSERRAGRGYSAVYLPGVGDLLEGCSQHYAMQPFEVELNSREQRRLARRLVLYSIERHAPRAERIVLPVVGGNHGENNRQDGKSTTSFGDNSDVEVYEGVAESVAQNPTAYGHVSFLIPGNDLTLTLQPIDGGPILGLAHGHQARRGTTPAAKMWEWWRGQAMGQRPIGDADILLAGHWHQLIIHRDAKRTLIVAPTIDSGSQWFAETAGMESAPAMLGFGIDQHGWSDPRLL